MNAAMLITVGLLVLPVLGWLAREALAELSLHVEARRYRRPLTEAERAAYGLPPVPPTISAARETPEEPRSATARGDGQGVNR